jgi:wobble nucleotide-excising tRNase
LITKIYKINNAGSYKDFDGSCIEDFKRFNFIYGENGSGKTILSKFFVYAPIQKMKSIRKR